MVFNESSGMKGAVKGLEIHCIHYIHYILVILMALHLLFCDRNEARSMREGLKPILLFLSVLSLLLYSEFLHHISEDYFILFFDSPGCPA